MTFSTAHEGDLQAFFSGTLVADMGVRSPMGGMLEAAMAAAKSEDAPAPPAQDWDRKLADDGSVAGGWLPLQIRKARQTSNGARPETTEAHPQALHAAQRLGHVKAVLVRMEAHHVLTLRAYYMRQPPGWYSGLHDLGEWAPLVCHLDGTAPTRAVCRRAQARVGEGMAPEQKAAMKADKAEAKRAMLAAVGQARRALKAAQAAYAVAAREQATERRRERLGRFVRVIGGVR